MERLTKRIHGNMLEIDVNDDEAVTRCISRLAAYEDTGLTPPEVLEFATAKAEGRLVELPVAKGNDCWVRRIAEETTLVKGKLVVVGALVDSQDERMLMAVENVFSSYAAAESAMKGERG